MKNPFELLGPHEVDHLGRRALAVRAYLPNSNQAWVVDPRHDDRSLPMRRIHPAGLFEAICPMLQGDGSPRYRLRVAEDNGKKTVTMHDPYSFPHLLTDFDRHLLNEGRHWHCYNRLGAQLRNIDGVDGVNFAVWAPNATQVSIIGDFNQWDGRRHPMRKHIPSGFWELFVPGLGEGTLYKYQVRHHGQTFEKADPFGFAAEVPPRTASKVADLSRYTWHDADWMTERPNKNWLEQPISCYEVHLGSWRRPGDDPTRWLSYRDMAHQLADYCKEVGYTHVELMPVSEHPLSASWGYQTVGYYAATSRYGSPQDFMYFVDLLSPERHRRALGLGTGPFPPRRTRSAAVLTGPSLYEHADPAAAASTATGVRRYSITAGTRSRNFLVSNALVLDGQVPHRRDPRGCRGFDALLGLQPPGRRLDSEQVRRSGEPRCHIVPEGRSTSRPICQHPGVLTDRRGVDRLARCIQADLPGWVGIQPEVEHGLDERHARLHAARSDPPQATTTTT